MVSLTHLRLGACASNSRLSRLGATGAPLVRVVPTGLCRRRLAASSISRIKRATCCLEQRTRLRAQLRIYSWTAIDLPVFVKDAMDLSGEFAIW